MVAQKIAEGRAYSQFHQLYSQDLDYQSWEPDVWSLVWLPCGFGVLYFGLFLDLPLP